MFIRNAGIDDFHGPVCMPFRGTAIREQSERGEPVDFRIVRRESDGEVSGAYAVKAA
jgi:hypothetical protein